jgi:hypothetical protein
MRQPSSNRLKPTLVKAGLTAIATAVALALLVGCGLDRSMSGPVPARSPASILGVWGGEHIRMTIEPEGAVIQYDCGEGSIDTGIVPDAEGRFQAEGTFTPGGGPDPIFGRPRQAAIYAGTILDGSMDLTCTVIDTSQSLGSFNLTFSDNGRLMPCY